MSRIRPVTVVVAAVEVLCPHCGENVPSPDGGSFMWTLDADRAGFDGKRRTCDSCDGVYFMSLPSKVLVEAKPGAIGGAS